VTRALLLLLLGCSLAAPSIARAHGREPSVGLITFDRSDPNHIVMRTTWTLIESYDGGESWFWRCAVSVGYERTTEDPPVVIASDGTVMVGIFNGLMQSDPTGCNFDPSADEDVDNLYLIDLIDGPDGPQVTYGVTSPGDQANTVVRSADDGSTWTVLGTPSDEVLLERVRVAPSDPTRIYTSGAIPARGGMERRALFFRSDDAGRTYTETQIPLEGEERNLHVLAVDPTNPDRVLVRVVRLVTDTVPERLLVSEDGGETFETAASLLEITGLAFSDDGSQVWVGGWDGAFLRSDEGGAAGTFVPVVGQEDLRVRCLTYRPGASPGTGELWICADELRYDYALGVSTDGGSTIENRWGFADVRIDTGCPACSAVGGICPTYWPDVVFDLGLPDEGPAFDAGVCDAGPFDGGALDAGIGAEVEPPTGCGCRAQRRASLPIAAIVLGLGLALALARRR
jgi:hypothetical protein